MSNMGGISFTNYIDDTISRIYRLKYQLGTGIVSDKSGAIEIVFSAGSVLQCDSGPDGETISVQDFAWVDPFSGPLSPENEEFVRTSGRWTKQDASSEDMFVDLLGRKLVDIAPVTGLSGKLYGLLLNVSGYLLAIYANGDELHVQILD